MDGNYPVPFISVGGYTEGLFAKSGLKPLLVNLESMTTKPGADGGSEGYVPWG